MFLTKRPNGYYYLYYEKSDGKRTSVSTGTKKKTDANIFLNNFRKSQTENSQIKFGQFSNEYLKYSEQIHSPTTTKAIKVIFKEFNSYFESITLDKITKIDASNYIMRKRNVSPHIAQKHLAHLRKSFNYAIELGLLSVNPFSGIKNFRIPELQPIYFSREDFKKLLSVIENRDFKDIVIFSLYTGMRRAEVVNLRWSQIDMDKRLITLDNRNHINKSKKIRSIPMNEEVFNLLCEKNKYDTFVFTLNEEKFKLDFITKKFKKYIKKAKLNNDYKWHSLRHTFASWLVQNETSIYVVSKLLGHSDIKTTEIYAHLDSASLLNGVNKINYNCE